mmetsp:Transcript_21340/g.49563  ORF Transcript_21340/g.49563 Transcript_21340/m.49563 type:complete len:284 (-) Transcript_21340:608-1459(-)
MTPHLQAHKASVIKWHALKVTPASARKQVVDRLWYVGLNMLKIWIADFLAVGIPYKGRLRRAELSPLGLQDPGILQAPHPGSAHSLQILSQLRLRRRRFSWVDKLPCEHECRQLCMTNDENFRISPSKHPLDGVDVAVHLHDIGQLLLPPCHVPFGLAQLLRQYSGSTLELLTEGTVARQVLIAERIGKVPQVLLHSFLVPSDPWPTQMCHHAEHRKGRMLNDIVVHRHVAEATQLIQVSLHPRLGQDNQGCGKCSLIRSDPNLLDASDRLHAHGASHASDEV